MASLITHKTVAGNLTRDPEVRYTQSGQPVASFSVASTPRVYDKAKQEWVDDETIFTNCTVWGKPAEHLAASARKGDRVVVVGQEKSRPYQDREGNNRTGIDLIADEVALSVMFRPVGGGSSKSSAPVAGEAPTQADDEPW
jgi:single-strand DNA-binding protein